MGFIWTRFGLEGFGAVARCLSTFVSANIHMIGTGFALSTRDGFKVLTEASGAAFGSLHLPRRHQDAATMGNDFARPASLIIRPDHWILHWVGHRQITFGKGPAWPDGRHCSTDGAAGPSL
jgi:hypothetical protein